MPSPYQAALRVIRVLHANGHEALFAGGCVRDLLLKRRPQDYDIATAAHPEEVERLFKRTILVGKAFGVIRVRVADREIEVATFRTESGYQDGRHPTAVRFATAQEDASRRDFTVNGLFYNPVRRRLQDFVGGRADLSKHLLRAIGRPRERFQEDHLRLLRGIRFAAQLNFKIAPETWKALRGMAARIRRVSAERIRDELTKLLLASQASKGLELLSQSGLMRQLLPEIQAMRGIRQPRDFHPEGDVFVHTRRIFPYLHRPTIRLAWAALLHDVGKPPTFQKTRSKGRVRIRFNNHSSVGARITHRILTRLRFSTADRDAITSMVANHMTFKDVRNMRLSTLKRLLARPTFAEELLLHRADCLASHGQLTNVRFLRKKQRELSVEEIRPPRWITGHDLIRMGLLPGPAFKQILSAVEEAQLEGKINNRQEALELVQKLA